MQRKILPVELENDGEYNGIAGKKACGQMQKGEVRCDVVDQLNNVIDIIYKLDGDQLHNFILSVKEAQLAGDLPFFEADLE